jgi:hypothetical protein
VPRSASYKSTRTWSYWIGISLSLVFPCRSFLSIVMGHSIQPYYVAQYTHELNFLTLSGGYFHTGYVFLWSWRLYVIQNKPWNCGRERSAKTPLVSSRVTWLSVFKWGVIPSTSATLPLVWRGNPKDIVAIQSASPCPKMCPPNFSHASENPPGGAPEKSDKNLITLSQIIFSDWLHISIINSVTELAKWMGKDKIVYSVNPDQLR